MDDRVVVLAENFMDESKRFLAVCLGDKDIPSLFEEDCQEDEELVWYPIDDAEAQKYLLDDKGG